MRAGLGLAQEPAPPRPVHEAPAKEIPYDYVAKFKLQGNPGNRVQDVINISVDGSFIAVAIAYSLAAPPSPRLEAIPVAITRVQREQPDTPPPTTTLTRILAETLAGKLSLSLPGTDSPQADRAATVEHLSNLVRCFLYKACGVQFKYSIVDSGTGRELQNQPIHNIAGLGESGGERPFRPFAKPMLFQPRSTIRIEIEEISQGPLYAGAELYIVLHGYKVLG